MPARKRVAIIGCGGIAKLHADSYMDMPEVDLVALSDIRQEALEQFGEKYGVPNECRFARYEDMLDAAKPDIAVVATRPDVHAEPSIAALGRGIHVLCEKPIALDLAQADAMVAASAASGAKLAINTQRHTDPVFLHARRMLHDGVIGDLRTIRSECKSYPAGIGMSNIGAHLFDAMALFGGPAKWVFAHLTNEAGDDIAPGDVGSGDRGTGTAAGDVGCVHIGYKSGAMGVSEYWEGTASYGFELEGTTGALAMRGSDPVVLHTAGGGGKATEAIEWNAVEVPLSDSDRRALGIARWGLHPMMQSLIDAIETDRDPACSGRDGTEALEITMAAYVSQKAGARAHLPLADRRHPLVDWSA